MLSIENIRKNEPRDKLPLLVIPISKVLEVISEGWTESRQQGSAKLNQTWNSDLVNERRLKMPAMVATYWSPCSWENLINTAEDGWACLFCVPVCRRPGLFRWKLWSLVKALVLSESAALPETHVTDTALVPPGSSPVFKGSCAFPMGPHSYTVY